MAEQTLNNAALLDCMSNLYNANAAIKAAASDHLNDSIYALDHAAEGLLKYVEAAEKDETEKARSEAFVRIGCLADLVNEVNVKFDDQLLHAAAVLLHLASAQLTEEPVAVG